MTTKKRFKDYPPHKSFKDGDKAWVKDAEDDRGKYDANLRGEDPNAGLGLFRWFDLNDSTNQELALWSDWCTEINQIFGGDILYYRVSHIDTNMDQLYGEDVLARYGKPKRCRALFEDIKEPNRFWSAFGMMSDDVFSMTMPKKTYSDKIDMTGTPHVGDIIRTTWNHINYEVVYVHDHPQMAYVSHMWSFTLKRFEYTYQEGVKSIGDVEDPYHGAKESLITDSTSSEFGGADNIYIEERSDDVINYDDYPDDLNSDIFGEY